ncbi:S8 family serine peptidase [Cupriavidus sp. SS-3]|uniref:S8 family serine peptidase n=1 Tax=Cupriavidus sp. SS-3 TaxID=3109596 RepID=UPI002DC04FB5|nr:S8 family serine peptidase [Cupriavidus sp. SS-3]MEC3764931.1 S8 family serine peptidase [Cupriavidus sp. SS-3]
MERDKKGEATRAGADRAATPGAGSREAVALDAGRKQYLIAPRRHVLARQAGVAPMSASELHSTVTQLPGVEVVHVVEGHKNTHLHSVRPDEAAHTYVVKLDAAHAQMLQATAPPHMIVEEDHPLGYGRKAEIETSDRLHPQSAFDGPLSREVLVRVLGTGDTPLPGVAITLAGDGFPATATTDASGEATLTLVQQQPGPARSLFVRPLSGYWNKYLLSPNVVSGQANVIRVTPLSQPNPDVPPHGRFGWGQRLMGLDRLTRSFGGRGVRVAVVDSGADAAHPLLAHIRHGMDLTGTGADAGTNANDTWRLDTIGHGSHCAGVVGARPQPGAPASASAEAQATMLGFAPEAEMHALKIFPGGQFSTLLRALDYCIDHDVDVVNLSLGAPQPSQAVEQKLIEAVHSGVACIVAAGNSGGPVQYPAASASVLAVSALGLQSELPHDVWERTQVVQHAATRAGLFAPTFSCFGPQIAVCGPGVGIISTVPGAAFMPDSGTSMAAPHIAGLAALLLSDPQLAAWMGPRGPRRVAALFQLIRAISSPVVAHDPENRFGSGLPQLQNLQRLLGRPQ